MLPGRLLRGKNRGYARAFNFVYNDLYMGVDGVGQGY
jgi:hypothetical protein